jgi:hypothetical protein
MDARLASMLLVELLTDIGQSKGAAANHPQLS